MIQNNIPNTTSGRGLPQERGCLPSSLHEFLEVFTGDKSNPENVEPIEDNIYLVNIFMLKIMNFLDKYWKKNCYLVNICQNFYNNRNKNIESINTFLTDLSNDIIGDSEKDKDFPGMITTLFNWIYSLYSAHFGDENIDINIFKTLHTISNSINNLYQSVIGSLLNSKYDEEFFKNGWNFKFWEISIDSRNKYRLMKYFLKKRRDNSPKKIPTLTERLWFKSTVVMDFVKEIFSYKINLEINSINNSFFTELNNHNGNRYVEDFLNIIQTGKPNSIKKYIDSLIDEINNSKQTKGIIEFCKIVNSITENLGNDKIDESRMKTYIKRLEGEPWYWIDWNWDSRIYKCSMPYMISRYIKSIGEKINTNQDLKQESLEIDIGYIVNNFSNKLEELKKNSLLILNDFSKWNNTDSSDFSENDNDLVKIHISHIQKYIRDINNTNAIFEIPQEESKKYKEQLKELFRVFVGTYNQIVEKIGSTYDNLDAYKNKDKLKNLHDTIINFINLSHHYSTKDYDHEFMNMGTTKLNTFSKSDISFIESHHFLD